MRGGIERGAPARVSNYKNDFWQFSHLMFYCCCCNCQRGARAEITKNGPAAGRGYILYRQKMYEYMCNIVNRRSFVDSVYEFPHTRLDFIFLTIQPLKHNTVHNLGGGGK